MPLPLEGIAPVLPAPRRRRRLTGPAIAAVALAAGIAAAVVLSSSTATAVRRAAPTTIAGPATTPTADLSTTTTTAPDATSTTVETTSPPRGPPTTAPTRPPAGTTPTTIPPPAAPVGAHIIIGGVTVMQVQARLSVPLSGVWDEATDRAVRAFQGAQRIDVDGIVGPVTAGRLFPPARTTATVRPAPTGTACSKALAAVNAHGLTFPSDHPWYMICPGRGLAGTPNGHGSLSGCPPTCRSFPAVSHFGGQGPEGTGYYISIRDVSTFTVGYETANSILGIDANGNSHDRYSGGSLSPSTEQYLADHGIRR